MIECRVCASMVGDYDEPFCTLEYADFATKSSLK